MNNKELNPGKLLDENQNLNEAGFSFSLIKNYDRNAIKKYKSRIKEWDYYAILSKENGICFTISDCSIFALISVSLLDFKTKKYITKSYMKWFTFGKVNLPSTSKIGDIVFKNKDVNIAFLNDGKERIIDCNIKKFYSNKDLRAKIVLNETCKKSMVIATPFDKKGHFYYNQKINNLLCNGYFKYGNDEIKVNNYMGVLDWGRGIWTYSNTWYWASLSYQDGKNYKGFNLGYGFGDTSNASENMLFYNEDAYKLNDVTFKFQKDGKNINFSSPVIVSSKNKDIDLVFTPILDRKDHTNALIIESNQHQLFGYFNGKIKADGRIYVFKDALGFLEKVINRW